MCVTKCPFKFWWWSEIENSWPFFKNISCLDGFFHLIVFVHFNKSLFISPQQVDIKQFIIIIAFVALAFSGSIYLAMSAALAFDENFGNFWDVLLQEIRAMFEGKEFSDSYAQYHVALTLFVLVRYTIFFIKISIIIQHILHHISTHSPSYFKPFSIIFQTILHHISNHSPSLITHSP